jgi:hypothetical protein
MWRANFTYVATEMFKMKTFLIVEALNLTETTTATKYSTIKYRTRLLGWTTAVRFPTAAVRGFFFRQNVKTGFGARPASYPKANGVSFPGDQVPGV